ncbi:transcriptional regulator NrdR [Neisseriaceae bacterium CLB008]|nr:transcriptional repressor NrdR [Neisseriaceae bacterium]
MKCPFCAHTETQVVDSRLIEETNSVRRRRRCAVCDKRFNTFETAEVRLPNIIKSTGQRTEFDPQKLQTSFERALHKRPVSTHLVDEAVARIIQQLLQLGEREVTSRALGEMVMAELAKLDKVAYVRFASVYRSFADVDEFTHTIATLDQENK